MRRPKKDIQLTSYDELLGLEETSEKSMNQVVEIELEKLYPFKNHPFHVNDDEKMAETVESIKTYGVLTPALVRPRPDGGYEMISGHRRKRGCELCGKTKKVIAPVLVIAVLFAVLRPFCIQDEKCNYFLLCYFQMGIPFGIGKCVSGWFQLEVLTSEERWQSGQ